MALGSLLLATPAFPTKIMPSSTMKLRGTAGADLQRIALGGHTKTDNKLFSGGSSGREYQ